jgi:PAS domain S-box-containing protein
VATLETEVEKLAGEAWDGSLAGIQQIIDTLTTSQDLPRASELLLNEITALIECQVAAVYYLDWTNDEVTTLLLASTLPITGEAGNTWPLSGSWMERLIKSGLPLIQCHIPLPPPLPGNLPYLHADIKSSLWAPLNCNEQTIGVAALHSLQPNAFHNCDLAKLEAVGRLIAPAVESADWHLKTREQRKFAQALNRASRTLNSCRDTQQALETVCRESCQLLEVSWTILWEVAGEQLICRLAWPPGAFPTNGSSPHLPLKPPGDTVSARAVFTKCSQVMNQIPLPTVGELQEQLSAIHNASSVMAVPLLGNDQVLGVLETGHLGNGRKFTRRCLENAEALASHAAAALQNARLHQGLQDQTQQIATVDKIARIITSTLNIDEVYEQFSAEVKRLVPFDRININVINAADGDYTIKHLSGLSQPGRHSGDVVPLAGTLTQHVMGTGLPSITYDLAAESKFPADASLLEAGLRSRILLPLKCRGNIIGALTLHSCQPGAYGRQEQVLLERLANQIAPAVENARLYENALKEKERATAALADLKASKEALRESEEQYRSLFEQSRDAIYIRSKDGPFITVNQAALDLFGYTREQFTALSIFDLCSSPADQEVLRELLESDTDPGKPVKDFEVKLRRQDGTNLVCLLSRTPWKAADGSILGFQGIIHDVTDRKRLETQFLQSQKLESLGRLAGGIAHDFNNLLGGIMGYASLLKSRVDPSSEAHEFAQIIEKATHRGAQLTRQLITVARKGPFEARPVNVNEVMQEVVQILCHTLSKDVTMTAQLQPNLPLVQGEQTQIHQVLMNLCINAADAMPDGGTLTLSSREVLLDEDFCRQHISIQPGQYVQLTVADTGTGISEDDKPKIFDPFFTTKGPGKGTGLGLAVVHAIINNHGGLIEVSSTLGQGSLFKVYLPVCGLEAT